MTRDGLLAGQPAPAGFQGFGTHLERRGPLPRVQDLVATLERSDLRGRGGAGFGVGAKWRSVTSQPGQPVVVVNGAEGEPLSLKDRLLMETRPHLIIDGALLAATALDASEIIIYIANAHQRALQAMSRALAQRPDTRPRRWRLVVAPSRYVSGEETATVHFINDGVALPTTRPPRPFERGVNRRPTLVQNVESLAHVALIARYGDSWFKDSGVAASAGTVLLTVTRGAAPGTVVEVPQGAPLVDVLPGVTGPGGSAAILLGGYGGTWVSSLDAESLILDSSTLRARQLSLGCGVVFALPRDNCGIVATAKIVRFLAAESARQCGPCVFGLRAMADTLARVATNTGRIDDIDRLRRWAAQARGRGACRHPDGAAALVDSALDVFADDVARHQAQRSCAATVGAA